MKTNFKYFRIFLLLFVVTSFFAFSNMVLGQDDRSAQIIETLFQNTKIVRPEMVLKDFIDGKPTARVIVNLSKPARFQQTTNFNDMKFRKDLEESVNTVQDMVINLIDPSESRITNRFTYIFGFSAEVTPEGLQELTEIDEVVSIEKDEILHSHLAQGIPLMNASTVRDTYNYNGSGISIAICDTGIDYTHPMLGDGGFPNPKVIGGYDTGQNDFNPMDGNGHGTACAGIAAGDIAVVGDYIGGVAYNARLYALKITSTTSGGGAWGSDMVEAWEWCVTHQNNDPSNPIMVISTSFGGGGYTGTCDGVSRAMTTAAAHCVAAGITLFVSSGNDGYCNAISWPACISSVNSVGAVYDDDVGYHGYTICTDRTTAPDQVTCYSNSALFLTLFAPSHDAYTTAIVGYNSTFGGTSAACPYAAGSAACLQSAAHDINGDFLTPAEVRSKITSTGDLVTDPKAPRITKPRVNLTAAVDTLGSCTYSIDPTSANFDVSGGSGSVNVTTQESCFWTASRNAVWIHITSGDSGTGSGTVNYSVDPNTGSARTGTMTIAGQTFTVTQAGTECTYAINPTSANVATVGETGSVDVTTQAGCSWTAVSNDAWIHITSGDSGTGNGTVDYSVDENTGSARTGTMTIAGQTFTANQAGGGVCTYAIDPTSANFSLSGGTGSVDVTTQAGCSWTAVSNDDWIHVHVTLSGSGTGGGTVDYSVDENTGSARTGTMTIAGEIFTVYQAGGGVCTYAIDPTSANFSLSGGTGSVNVSTQAGCSWTAVSNDAWIYITSGYSGAGNGTVTYRVAFSRGVRTGTIIVAGQIFTVYQGSGVCTYAINPTSANVATVGETGSVDVTTQAGCSWTAVSNDAWIHITSGDSGTGNGTVDYSVDENTGSARTGTMTIAGQTFTANQAGGGVCTYAIDPTSANFSLSGGTGSVDVTTQAGCSWTAVSNDDWIHVHVTLSGSGTGGGTVDYSVDENTGSARTGTMTIAGEIFTVYQAGVGVCTYAIDPTSVHINRFGGTGSVNVTTQAGCTWTAVSNDRWIYISSGNSGTGNGTVTFSVSFLHRSLTSRTGTMTIAGEIFTVYQP